MRSQLELEFLRIESKAWVTASVTSAANAAKAQRSRTQADRDDEDLQGEVPPKVADLSP